MMEMNKVKNGKELSPPNGLYKSLTRFSGRNWSEERKGEIGSEIHYWDFRFSGIWNH